MTRKFRTADYDAMLNVKVNLGDALPPDRLARCIVDVISQLDLSPIYQQYSEEGAPPYAPELLLGLIISADPNFTN